MLQAFFDQVRENEALRGRQRREIEIIKSKLDVDKIVPFYAFLTCFFDRGEEGALLDTPYSKYVKDFYDQAAATMTSLEDIVMAIGPIPPLPIRKDKIYTEDRPYIETVAKSVSGTLFEGVLEKSTESFDGFPDGTVSIDDNASEHKPTGTRIITMLRESAFIGFPLQSCLQVWDVGGYYSNHKTTETLDTITEIMIKAGKGDEAIRFWEKIRALKSYDDFFPDFPKFWSGYNEEKREKEAEAEAAKAGKTGWLPGWVPKPAGTGA